MITHLKEQKKNVSNNGVFTSIDNLCMRLLASKEIQDHQ